MPRSEGMKWQPVPSAMPIAVHVERTGRFTARHAVGTVGGPPADGGGAVPEHTDTPSHWQLVESAVPIAAQVIEFVPLASEQAVAARKESTDLSSKESKIKI